jgi:PAS domain S-box-containing protein
MNTLLDTYLVIHNKRNRQINNYQQVLYTLSIMLLIFVAYILLRLNRASISLTKTIRALDDQKFAMDQHAIVSIADNNGKITYANQKFCDITGYSNSEIIGKTHDIIKSGYHPDSFFKEIEISGQTGEVWHGRVRHKNKTNEHYWTDTTFVSFVNESDTAYQFITIQTDITDIKEAQEKLHLQSSALEVAANGILITDSNGVILWTNKAFTKITGYALNEVINKTTDFLNSGKQDKSFFKNIWDTILEGQAWHGEIINRKKDGSLYTEEQTISPVLNSNGEISHFISIKQDVSSRKQTEEALRRSQKMDAIGQLSGGIAHDFNNQLGIVIGYLDFLKEVFSDDPRPSRYIENASKAAVRCVDLTRQLLIFSRNQKKETTVVDLNLLLQEQRTMITRSITPEIEVQYYLADDLWPTVANSGEFQDAILNLAINARDAMPNGGNLLIETSNKIFDEQFSKSNPGIIAGEYAQIMISDTGTGMDTETQEHIFEPFYTTKPEGKGTGLGLAMVYGFVKRYKGYIKVYSEPGIGTTFRLHLPRSVSPKNIPGDLNALKTDLPGGNESILIVDDETDLLELAKNYLFDLGYRTFVAKNAHQALQVLARESSINLLFSDVVMPGGMNGYELAKKTSEEYPHIKVLLTSGFTSKTIAQNGLARFSTNLLDKPYRKADLAVRVRLVLDEKSDS